jgi:hypothetical protein
MRTEICASGSYRQHKLVLVTALFTVLAGCGGGGDATSAAPTLPVAGSPPASAPPAGSVATLADFEACPDVPGNLAPSTTWPATCLVGKRIVGTGLTKFNDPTSSTVSCELLFKLDGSFEYTKDGRLLATTQPYTAWADLVGVYNSNIDSYRAGTTTGNNGIWIFQAKLGGNPAIAGSAFSNQVAFGIELNKFRSTPIRNQYTLAFSVGGLANLQSCNLNLL